MKSAPNKDFSGFIDREQNIYFGRFPVKPLLDKAFSIQLAGIQQGSGFQAANNAWLLPENYFFFCTLNAQDASVFGMK